MVRYAPADTVFPTDRPLSRQAMVGRADEVGELTAAISNGMNQIVVGPRRMGKTTLCRAVLDAAKDEGQYAAQLDLFGIPSLSVVADRLVDAAIGNRSAWLRARHALKKGGRSVASAATLKAVGELRDGVGDGLALALEPGYITKEPLAAFEKALQMCQRVAELDDRRLVLFIDEFQEMGGPHAPFGNPDQVTKLMRAVLQQCDRVTTLFAGSLEHMMRDLFAPAHRAFYQWGAWHALRPIETSEWLEGLEERFGAQGLSLTRDAAQHLLELSEGHVRVTMLLAKQAYLATILAGDNQVARVAVATALEMAMAADAPSHETSVGELRGLGRHVLDVAERVARGEPPYAGRPARSTQRAIDTLASKGLIQKLGSHSRGGWRMIDPLLRRYLAER